MLDLGKVASDDSRAFRSELPLEDLASRFVTDSLFVSCTPFSIFLISSFFFLPQFVLLQAALSGSFVRSRIEDLVRAYRERTDELEEVKKAFVDSEAEMTSIKKTLA